MRQLRDKAQIKMDTVTYNIKWKDNINSYIQVGDISKRVKSMTRYQKAESFDHFGLTVTDVVFKKGG